MDIEQQDLLRFIEVGKRFTHKGRQTSVLTEISFSVKRGEFVTLLGPSGCGKTTLLKLVAGLDTCSTGEIIFDGAPVTGPDRRRGLVFQSYSVFPWLNVRRNMEFGLAGLPSEEREIRIAHWLEATGLTEFAHSYPKTLSGGMRQRLALARTMIVQPELILLDEALGALDENTRANMQMLLLDVVESSGCSAVMVTHSIREAIFLSDRVFLMSHRPGTIKNCYVIPAQRPRSRDYMRSLEFSTMYEEILADFPT